MAQPIRWDNIVSRGNGEAVAGINSAASLFRGAFTDLQDTLKDRENIEAANWQNTKVNNTNTYLDQVAQMRDIDQLKAGQGQLDALKQQFGAQIDSGAVRGAMDQRMSTLMDQRAKEVGYNKLMRDERTAPIMDTLKRAALEGKKDVFDQAMAAYTAAGGTDGAGAVKYMLDRERQVVEQGQGDRLFNDKLVTSAAERTHMVNQDRNSAAQVSVARMNAETNLKELGIRQEEMLGRTEDRLSGQLNAAMEAMGKRANVSAGSVTGQATITDYINKIKDQDIQDNARDAVAKMVEGNPTISVAGALAGIGSIGKRDWFKNGDLIYSNSNNIDDAVARGQNFDKSPEALDYQRRQELGYKAAQDNYSKISERLDQIRNRRDGNTSGIKNPVRDAAREAEISRAEEQMLKAMQARAAKEYPKK